ncbi:MAG: hypothetical protein EXS09_02550 [Gemmataceae bacterium]|nr:hypothetical protein [Gemmataceae bacterium]
MDSYQSPPESPQPSQHPTLRHDLFTAVLLPIGAIAGIIFTFALLTTERLVIPGYTGEHSSDRVSFLDLHLGTTDTVHHYVWGIGFLAIFSGVGTVLGFLAGKGMGRLTHWKT